MKKDAQGFLPTNKNRKKGQPETKTMPRLLRLSFVVMRSSINLPSQNRISRQYKRIFMNFLV